MQYLEEVNGERVQRTEQNYMIARLNPDFLQVMAWDAGVIWRMQPRRK